MGLPTHLFPADVAQLLSEPVSVYLVSVVAEQTKLWEAYPDQIIITRKDIPLRNTYATLGNDRALCAYGAGETYGYPVLVIDAGTALTYTAVGKQRDFLGGAILPGLRLQLRALGQQTAALPEITLPDELPPLWAMSTASAIASGTIHTLISGIHDYVTAWRKKQSDAVVVLTGGDASLLHYYLQNKYPILSQQIIIDSNLMFQGMAHFLPHYS
jgi:type III pantothenate kinase